MTENDQPLVIQTFTVEGGEEENLLLTKELAEGKIEAIRQEADKEINEARRITKISTAIFVPVAILLGGTVLFMHGQRSEQAARMEFCEADKTILKSKRVLIQSKLNTTLDSNKELNEMFRVMADRAIRQSILISDIQVCGRTTKNRYSRDKCMGKAVKAHNKRLNK